MEVVVARRTNRIFFFLSGATVLSCCSSVRACDKRHCYLGVGWGWGVFVLLLATPFVSEDVVICLLLLNSWHFFYVQTGLKPLGFKMEL